MTRTEKVKKLANAIREYRGASSTPADADNVLWKYPPKPSAVTRVKAWLERLKLDIADSMKRIDGFKSFGEFEAWLRTIS